MAVADITLINTNVNSGTAVKLGGASVTYNWKNLLKSNTVPNKHDISEATNNGFESPIIKITGTIPIDLAITNHISQTLLVNFATCTSDDTTLSVTAGKTGGTNLGGRPTAGYVQTGSNTLLTSLKVAVRSFTITFSAKNTIEGEGWFYSLILQETV